jgi:predicted Rdx family selenoprotein
MQYEIKFCVGCYLPAALDLTKALLDKHVHDEGFALKLVPGESGQFDVKRGGQVVYSKADRDPLPSAGDIEPDLQSQTSTDPERASGKSCNC